ncbi:hypothetical protein J7L27_07485 [Candidatus Bathyarchaeota archaeon]|nr:hypothetical protein [Candidatus Bathyarchaeota archaeon]
MNILVQKDISDISSRRIFAQISSEALTLKDIVISLSGIIDDEKNGYHMLPLLDAKSEILQRLDVYTSLRRERADKAYVISNGRNTIYLLDYVVKTRKVYHDPVLCIIGPDAEEIAKYALERLSRLLLSRTYKIELNEEAIRDFSRLTGCEKREVIENLLGIFEEAKIALKMKFFKGDINEAAVPPSSNGLSKEILRDIEKKSLYREPADPKSIIPFAITIILIVLLLIILMRI